MNQVVKYDKTLQERLQEYRDIFYGCHSIFDIKHNLSAYLELEMDHCGWQAVWKIPRFTCEDLKIPYPAFALVFVVNMNCLKQIAEVRVLYTSAYIDLEECHIVPLAQLWLTKEQDHTVVLNLESTGNALDILQFFYTNLFMPWDEDDNINWVENHLEHRLRLFYDIQNGIVPSIIAERFKFLLAESKRLHVRCLNIQKQLKGENVDFDDDSDDLKLNEIVQLEVRKMEMRKEIELLEIPNGRRLLIKRHKTALKEKTQPQEKKRWIVCNGSYDDCILFLQTVKKEFPTEIFKSSINLVNILQNPETIEIVALCAGMHTIKDFGCIDMSATIKAFNKNNTVITSISENIMFDLNGCVIFENLTIDASKSQCAILIRSGKVVLKNCKIFGDNKSSTHQGFIVLKGSTLELFDCLITGFGTGIVGNSNSNINLYNCEICNVNYGFKIHDNCNVEIVKSTFQDCNEYGILIETDNGLYGGGGDVGDFSILNR